MALSPIRALLFRCSPSAISGLIIATIVNPIYGVDAAGPGPHIRIEVRERIFPSFANTYSPPAVTVPPPLFRVGASAFHREPRIVRDGLRIRMPMPSGLAVRCNRVFLEAPATKVLPHSKVARPGDRLVPALTNASPYRLWTFVRNPLYHGKPSDFLAREVDKCAHL